MLFLFTVSSLQAFSLFLGVSSLFSFIIGVLWTINEKVESGIAVWFILTCVFTSMLSILYFSIKLVLFGLGVI